MHEVDKQIQRILTIEHDLKCLNDQLYSCLESLTDVVGLFEKEKEIIFKDYFSKRSPSAVETLKMAEKAKQNSRSDHGPT